MTTAFVLTGGGSLGAVQVGMLHVLAERDVRPDLLVGTSVGALNAAFVAGRGFRAETVAELEAIWRSVRRVDVFPFQQFRHLRSRHRAARKATRTRLDEGGATVEHPERFLSLHGHAQESPPQPDGATPEACPHEPGSRGALRVHL